MPGPFRSILAGEITWRPPIVVPPGGNQTITPSAAIPSGQSWPTPVVAGPITLGAVIASGETWFAPTVKLTQTITPGAAIATGETWFSPAVQNLQAIVLSGKIASGETWFAPTIRGNPQFINPGMAILSGESWPTPLIQGGNPSLKIYIGGIDRTSVFNGLSDFSPQGAGSHGSACTITSQTIGRATLTFDITNLNGFTYTPVLGQTVKVTEGEFILFAGCIDTIVTDLELGSQIAIVYHVTALDKSSICDHRVVKQVTYPLGTPVQSVVLDIVQNYLNGEGITTQGVPTNMGFLTSDLPFNYTTVTDAFNQIQTLAGMVWWIDFFGVLHFSAFDSLPAAPWGISTLDGSLGFIRPPASGGFVTQTLSGAGATSGYRNTQYVVSNLNILPGSSGGGGGGASGVTETFTWANGQTGVRSQYVAGVLQPVQIQVSLALGSIQSITVNGHLQTVVEYSQFSGQTSSGPNDFLWFYTSNQSGVVGSDANITTPTFGPLPTNATVVITYIPGGTTSSAAAQVGEALVPTDPFGNTFGTCGSGIYEAVQQVKNISTQADLDAIAQGILDRAGGVPIVFNFETDKPGLFVGQALSCFVPVIGLEAGSPEGAMTLLITQIQGVAQTGPLEFGSWFRWQVTAVSNHDPGNWVTYFTNLIARSNNPLPVLQQDIYTFVLGPGTNIGGGVVVGNPVYIKRTGLVSEIFAGAGIAPIDQDMVLTFTDITTGVIIGSVTIPAGDTSQHTVQIPSSSQIYCFTKDQISVTVKYNQTGPSPSAAQSVTACLVTVM